MVVHYDVLSLRYESKSLLTRAKANNIAQVLFAPPLFDRIDANETEKSIERDKL
jgi:hypothetical protein